MNEINANLVAEGLRVAMVASRFNSVLVEPLVKGATDAFTRLGGVEDSLTLVRVPGAYEIPVVAKKLAVSGKYDAVVALGAVVQGATAHAGLITQTTARAFAEISLETGVPVADGIVAAETLEQAVERCGTKQGNRGFAAMQSAIETANVVKMI